MKLHTVSRWETKASLREDEFTVLLLAIQAENICSMNKNYFLEIPQTLINNNKYKQIQI